MKEKLTALLKENFSEIDFTESDALVDDGILESMTLVEIIATIVHAGPGKDGKYRSRLSDKQIEVYLRAARKHKALLVLDIQPGHADFLEEAMRLEKWLREPDVGLALDPEWRVAEGEVPGPLRDADGAVAELLRARGHDDAHLHLPQQLLALGHGAPRQPPR